MTEKFLTGTLNKKSNPRKNKKKTFLFHTVILTSFSGGILYALLGGKSEDRFSGDD